MDVDEAYKKQPPTTEILVRAALVRTLSQAEGINHVLMTVGGRASYGQYGHNGRSYDRGCVYR